uniref:Small ribosomal subunit protein uS3c n=1 Tax=Bridelia tomentosa TaxID=300990 RepID=A0A8E6Z9R0_9ROSI|nr:ribosomal protein S3 [Bridelia tomentosa]
MGQKINPLSFRLGTTQDHHSLWFAQPKNYSEGLQEDERIRNCITNYIQKRRKLYSNVAYIVEGIPRIEIQKGMEDNPTKIEKIREGIKEIQKELKPKVHKELTYVNQKLKFKLDITLLANPYGHPKILAEFIAGQLKNRVSFRKAMKKAIELTEQANTKGIQVQISGRLYGKEMARVDWIREGRVPLQTIRAKIDYCSYTVRTLYGIFGIKIWLFVDDKPYLPCL